MATRRDPLALGLCLVVSFLGACSSSASGDDQSAGSPGVAGASGTGGGPAAGATGMNGGSSGSAGATATTGGVGFGGAGAGGAGGTGTAGSSGASALTPARLLPLAVGNQWTFTTTAKAGMTSHCTVGTVMNAVTGSDTQAGRVAFELTNYCVGNQVALSFTDTEVDQLEGTTWSAIVSAPIAEGASWQTATQTFTWHGPVSVTVPAGTFEGCWERHATGLATVTYCPDVGTTKIDDTTYLSVLTAYVLK